MGQAVSRRLARGVLEATVAGVLALRGSAATVTDMTETNAEPRAGNAARVQRDPIDPYAGALAALNFFGVPNDGRQFTCPMCGPKAEPKKTKIRPDGGLTCYKCGEMSTGGSFAAYSTVMRLAEVYGQGELTKRQVFDILRGCDPFGGRKVFEVRNVPMPEPEPETFVDSEVLEALRQFGDLDAGVRYWAQFHFDPKVVRAFDGRVINTPWARVWGELVSTFGEERLIRAGLAKRLDDDSIWTVPGGKITDKSKRYPPDYNVLQFYKAVDGTPVGLEVRGNAFIAKLAQEHKEGKRPFVPKTRNLIGNAKGSRIGFGLDVVAKFPVNRVVWLVEGYKDALAAGSMKRPAIGLAGVNAGISEEALEVLRGRRVAVAFDGDEAGQESIAKVEAVLAEAGVQLVPGPRWPEGRDVADQLAWQHENRKLPCGRGCGPTSD